MEKTYRFIPRFNPVWMMIVISIVMAALILGMFKSTDLPGIAAGIIVIGFTAFSFYRSKSGLQRIVDRRLILNETVLRYEISGQAYSVTWTHCDHRVECIGRNAEVNFVTLVTRDGKWVTLNRFEDMPEIIATIRQYVPTSGPRGFAESALLLHRWPGFVLGGLAFLGMFIFVGSKQIIILPTDQSKLLAIMLIAPIIPVSLYMWSRSPLLKLGHAVQQQSSGSMVRRFFVTFAAWIVIIIVVLVILNFMPHK